MRDLVKPAISLFVICVVVSTLLAFTNAITVDKIKESEELAVAEAMGSVLSSADSFQALESLDGIAAEKSGIQINEVNKGFKADALVGYVIQLTTKGYGGDIRVFVGMDLEGKISGVRMGNNSETPGLGKKAAEPMFLSQMEGIVPNGPLEIVKNPKNTQEEIEAISGATISSRAMVNAVQFAIEALPKLVEMGGA